MNARAEWTEGIADANPSLRTPNQIADLTQIFDHDAQLAILSRAPDPDLVAYLERAIGARSLGGGFRARLGSGQTLAATQLPDLPGRDRLLDDIRDLSEIYGELLGCDEIAVRLEVVERAMCPRFHVDRVGIRLVCTYCGPGTEWLDDRYADRCFLGAGASAEGDAAPGLILDQAAIQSAPPFAVVLLKGSQWQGNDGRGVIHRSPQPGHGSPRVLVAMDAIWS